MIATPIGDPIGSRRVRPNRPRIAQYESCRVVPFLVGNDAFPNSVRPGRECELTTTRGPESLRIRLIKSFEVDPTAGCWNWTKAIGAGGYGRVTYQYKQWVAHRLMVWAMGWDVPDGMVTDHLCRNRKCVNPDHLEVVTKYENDMRGQSAWAKNARKTHCKRGHEFTPENTGRQKSGRFCITCRRATEALRHGYNVEAAMAVLHAHEGATCALPSPARSQAAMR